MKPRELVLQPISPQMVIKEAVLSSSIVTSETPVVTVTQTKQPMSKDDALSVTVLQPKSPQMVT